MKEVILNLGHSNFPVRVPDNTDVIAMGKALPLSNPEEKIRNSLANPLNSPPLRTLVSQKLKANPK
ncbi:unnamed protein product, partial [marine sediment metagenome]